MDAAHLLYLVLCDFNPSFRRPPRPPPHRLSTIVKKVVKGTTRISGPSQMKDDLFTFRSIGIYIQDNHAYSNMDRKLVVFSQSWTACT